MNHSDYFIELESFAIEELTRIPLSQERSHLSPEELERLANRMRDKTIGNSRILRKTADGQYQFNYVGIICCEGYLFPVLPKYMDKDEASNKSKLTLVLDVIDKYNKEQLELVAEGEQSEKSKGEHYDPGFIANTGEFGSLALWKFIVDDYLEFGPYSELVVRYEHNGNGEIAWERTVLATDPLIIKGAPYYVDYISRQKRNNPRNEVRLIQETILNQIMDDLSRLNLHDVLHIPSLDLPLPSRDIRDASKEFISTLRKARMATFSTSKRRTLNALLSYLEGSSFDSAEEQVLLFGTASFNMIWEAVCRDVFDGAHTDKLNESIDRVRWSFTYDGDQTTEVEDDGDGMSDEAGTPERVDESIDESLKGRLRPDVLSFQGNSFYILDAKYYTPAYSEGEISGQPGVGDVTKQYLYQAALYKVYDKHGVDGKHVVSAFLLPSADLGETLVKRRGGATLPFMVDILRLPDGSTLSDPIHLLELNAEEAFATYLGEGKDSKCYFDELRVQVGVTEEDSFSK